MQKVKVTLIVLLIFNNSFSQSFKNYEIKRLNMFEINTDSIALNNSLNYLNLKTILVNEQKRKTNKTLAIALTSLSALTMTYGAKIISSSRRSWTNYWHYVYSSWDCPIRSFSSSIRIIKQEKKR